MLEADKSGDFITMPELPAILPSHLLNSFMVRECYRGIVDLIMKADEERAASTKHGFGMVITGTPGIGKSVLALYLICRLAQKRQKVLYRCARRELNFCTQHGL